MGRVGRLSGWRDAIGVKQKCSFFEPWKGDMANRLKSKTNLLDRIQINANIFGGKPNIRGKRLAVEHVLSMLAAGDDAATILEGYPWMEREDILACLEYAQRIVGHERVEPFMLEKSA